MNEVSKELERLTVFTGTFSACLEYLSYRDRLAYHFVFSSTETKDEDKCSVVTMHCCQACFFKFLALVTDADLPYVVLEIRI